MRVKHFSLLCILLLIGTFLSAEKLPDSVLTKLNRLSPNEKVSFLIELSWQLREKETVNALQYAQKAIVLADSLGLDQKLGRANNNAGVILLHYMYKPKDAVPYLHTALELALANKDSINIAYAYNNLGDVYYLTSNAPLALDYAVKSMEYCKALNDSLAIAYTHINFGTVYQLEKQYNLALEHFFKAIDIRKKLNNKLGIASAYEQVGSVYYEMENYSKAMNFFELAYEKNKEINNKKWMAFSLDGIAHIFYKNGKYDKALAKFKDALKLNKERNHAYGEVDNKIGMALVYSRTNRRNQGEKLLKEAIKDAKKLSLPKKLLYAYKATTTFYINVRDFGSANKSFTRYQDVFDSLYSAQQFETLSEIQKRSEMNQRLKTSEHELAIKQIEERSFVITILLLCVVVVAIFWRYLSNRTLNQKLQESNKAKDKLFSIISHDLRNPFHALMGLLDILKDKELSTEEREEILDSLDVATRSTYLLLENLLSLSASKRGQVAFYPEQIEIKTLIESVISSIAPQLKEKDIRIDNNVEAIRIKADKKMLEIVLRNFITNAIKYSHKSGSIVLSSTSINDNFCLSIKDSGVGMDESTKNSLFKSEIQNSTHGTAGEKGTGIGLSLCKEFVEKHNGTIEVESQPDKGSTFTFCIPKSS